MKARPEKARATDDLDGLPAKDAPSRTPWQVVSSSLVPSTPESKGVTVAPVRPIQTSTRLIPAGAAFHRAGGIPGGAVEGKHPRATSECRMGESPERPRSGRTPGTQAATRPSSFRRGSEERAVPVRTPISRGVSA